MHRSCPGPAQSVGLEWAAAFHQLPGETQGTGGGRGGLLEELGLEIWGQGRQASTSHVFTFSSYKPSPWRKAQVILKQCQGSISQKPPRL